MNNIHSDTDIYNSTRCIYSTIVENINSDVSKLIEIRLYPLIEKMQRNDKNMKMIEHILYQLPEFQNLKKENEILQKKLSETETKTDGESKNEIKLEIFEEDKPENVVSEKEIYAGTSFGHNNHWGAEEASESEEEEEEEEATEEEEEAEEVEEEVEEAAAEEEEEEEAEEAEEVEEEEEAEASEAEEEEEAEASEAEEEEAEEEAAEEEEEVFIVTIEGLGNFYTNNETNGDIYKIEGDDEDVGDQVGKFVNKVATFI